MLNTSDAVGSWLLLDEKLDQVGDDLSSPVQLCRGGNIIQPREALGARYVQTTLFVIMLATILLVAIMAWHGRGRWY
jgi:hypothetical protein